MSVDPITTEVVASRLRESASTMEYALYHSGYSPILRESKDGTAGITDARGRVVILSGGLQYHFTAYQQAVQLNARFSPAWYLSLYLSTIILIKSAIYTNGAYGVPVTNFSPP